ncbi:hypothetical protein [Tenacibaculum aestuariivivum]|uniref:hypothetical protein n=1 Tax=Tenacibaculum aestuariivivum TaxID=2006131 RepID=UPI003AB3D185
MKKITPLLLALCFIITSCSSDDSQVTTSNDQLLLSYTLHRDSKGKYSIDFNTTKNTDVITIKNSNQSNEIILTEANYKTKKSHSNSFIIEKELLKIGFLDENKGKRTQITIEDENNTFSRTNITEFLNSYSITKNEDDTFLLNFKVNDNVITKFIYNKNIETYEVHLSKGRAKQKDFSRIINILSEDGLLKVDFVNHKYSEKIKGPTGAPRKPRFIIGGADEA